jgi:truncated hemoglobin YjbI
MPHQQLVTNPGASWRFSEQAIREMLKPTPVQNQDRQRWLEVCAQAAVEEDPDRLMELAEEIARMLRDEELRLREHLPIKLAS